MNEIGIYIHIPFCKAKCNYCDFNSFADKNEFIPEYFNALKKEISSYVDRIKQYTVKTIFIGGGTPSLVEYKYICELIEFCKIELKISETAEISIETNPGTLDEIKLSNYKKVGINRLSIGLQAWQDNLLHSLGRIHSKDEFLESYYKAKKAGFNNINLDLIFGIPGQTMNDWEETIDNVINLKPAHLSCYSLKVEEGTRFGDMYESGDLVLLDDELDRDMYHYAIERLSKAGYKHYEISNFALEDSECKHNLIYWKSEEYIGLGAGAHSYFNGERYNNEYEINNYMSSILNKGNANENSQIINKRDCISEFMFLGLRLIKGINANEFKNKFDEDLFDLFGNQLKILEKKGMLIIDKDRIWLTPLGIDLSNQVFIEFI